MKIKIRPETEKDLAKKRKINTAAFDTEAEANIVDDLRKSSTPVISLVAEVNGKVVGSCFEPSGFFPPFWLRACRKIRNQM